jgi:hypothetical protein
LKIKGFLLTKRSKQDYSIRLTATIDSHGLRIHASRMNLSKCAAKFVESAGACLAFGRASVGARSGSPKTYKHQVIVQSDLVFADESVSLG